ncbi:XrtA system polysaccharide deacetylase [Alteromonas sp. 14N.309.X.WAT.G.H12]|uniref:XrtA system polysaccharide deacetylase n=1 Tax=Alteromonas sp. 14N.309.X.WAT.G.H12 TaxID=3120824 RepID=UPI002FD345E5
MHKMNAMTVDVEDYFQVAAFDGVISRKVWDDQAPRVATSTRRILALFKERGVKATFFTLGWVAERYPSLVREIVNDGHELASHGYDHQRATLMTPETFYNDVVKAKAILEDVSGVEVIGYRAPSFSIMECNEWAFSLLRKAGYQYSSSTYSINHDHYGTPDWPNEPYQLSNGLWEFPQSTVDVMGKRLPAGGGGFFRLQPYFISANLINRFHKQKQHPYIFYFHPWEIDRDQPRISGAPLKSKIRHYINLAKMFGKIEALASEFKWVSMRDAHQDYLICHEVEEDVDA